jgi:hypothetical protein
MDAGPAERVSDELVVDRLNEAVRDNYCRRRPLSDDVAQHTGHACAASGLGDEPPALNACWSNPVAEGPEWTSDVR